jgi:hypothetical protein
MKYTSNQQIILQPYEARPLAASGSVIDVDSADAPFLISIDGGEEFPLKAGYVLNRAPESFNRLVLRNPTAVVLGLSLYIGTSQVSVSRPTVLVTNMPTYAKGSGQIVIPSDGTYVGFTGLDGVKVRKQFMVACQGVGTSIFICDAAKNGLAWVQYPGTWTAEVGGQIWLRTGNIGVGSVGFVGEIFYA